MDALHFDALTRRLTLGLSRRGLGLLALLGPRGLLAFDPAVAKRKKRKKKPCPPCKRRKKGKCKGTLPDGTPCSGGSCHGGACRPDACPGQRRCGEECIPTDRCCTDEDCPDGTCQDGVCQTGPCPGQQLCEGECIPAGQCCTDDDCPAADTFQCCNGECRLPDLQGCTENADCCSDRCIFDQCWPCLGKSCAADGDCCDGLSCEAGWCGGACRAAAESCSDDPCCFSDCNEFVFPSIGRLCLSLPGQRCTFDFDCWDCWVNNQCFNACIAGKCFCPDECCADSDCLPAERCVDGKCQPEIEG